MRRLPVKQRLTIPQSTNVDIGIDTFDTILGLIFSSFIKVSDLGDVRCTSLWSVGCFALTYCRKTHVGGFCHS
jgi:hypothetical protein